MSADQYELIRLYSIILQILFRSKSNFFYFTFPIDMLNNHLQENHELLQILFGLKSIRE
jgi:hypothetical protein